MISIIQLGKSFYGFHERLKLAKDRVFIPLVKILPNKVTPNHITLFRFLINLGWAPFALFQPNLNQVFIFFLVYFLDLYDGAVARFKNEISKFGKYFDALSDRVNFAILFILFLGLSQEKFITLKLLLLFEIISFIFIFIESFEKKPRFCYIRFISQVVIETVLWLGLIYQFGHFQNWQFF